MSWRRAALNSNTPAVAEAALAQAYVHCLAGGNGTREQGQMVVADLAAVARFYSVPSLDGWMKGYGTASGFDIYCAQHAAKRELFARILQFLNLTDDGLVALERAALLESARGSKGRLAGPGDPLDDYR